MNFDKCLDLYVTTIRIHVTSISAIPKSSLLPYHQSLPLIFESTATVTVVLLFSRIS